MLFGLIIVYSVSASTAPEYVDRCEPDLASDKSSECDRDALFCTGYAFIGRDRDGNPDRKMGCRPCEVMAAGAKPDAAVHDPYNVCNCAGGEFCRHTGLANELDNREIGYCYPSTLVGAPCITNANCTTGEREDSTDGGKSRTEVGFCVRGQCGQCDPDMFAQVMGSPQHVCPGYTLQTDGARVYANSLPGVMVTCSPDGRLVTSGQPNFELKAGNAPPQQDKPSKGHKDDEEPGYVLGLLISNFVLLLCLVTVMVAGAVMLWRVRSHGRRIPPPSRMSD